MKIKCISCSNICALLIPIQWIQDLREVFSSLSCVQSFQHILSCLSSSALHVDLPYYLCCKLIKCSSSYHAECTSPCWGDVTHVSELPVVDVISDKFFIQSELQTLKKYHSTCYTGVLIHTRGWANGVCWNVSRQQWGRGYYFSLSSRWAHLHVWNL